MPHWDVEKAKGEKHKSGMEAPEGGDDRLEGMRAASDKKRRGKGAAS